MAPLCPGLAVFLWLCWATSALREFRSWSRRTPCEQAADPNYPFAYNKYAEQTQESKARVNSNLQDFRHSCTNRGGLSKCHICETIICNSTNNFDRTTGQGSCFLQLQGVDYTAMSQNIPTVTDTAWAVGGLHRKDFGGNTTSHFCVFTSNNGYNPLTGRQASCIHSTENTFDGCSVRCFGYFAWISSSACTSDQINTQTCTKALPAMHFVAPNSTIIDTYEGMNRWPDDGQVDVWVYPRNCTELKSQYKQDCIYTGKTPSFNPQGFTFTSAGTGKPGFVNGAYDKAEFQSPQDVAVDNKGNIYVADTMNNAIRMIDTSGRVTTIAGLGPTFKGDVDGNCSSATFAEPKGLDVTVMYDGTTVIIVADTANHRIRRIDYKSATKCTVKCLSGLCGNNTISATDYKQRASPYSGYADGNGTEARFSAPQSVAIMHNNFIAVADTGNFLIRLVYFNGSTITLAGKVIPGLVDNSGKPLPGCQPPCMAAQSGYRDGNLQEAEFLNPVDITPGPGNNSLYIADDHRIRMIELAHVNSTAFGITSSGRVSTVAGTARQGIIDGLETEATFFNPQGVFVTRDGLGYVIDQGSCRVRRITPLPQIANRILWSTSAVSLIRPSGCTSFEQPYDKSGYKVTRTEKTLQYNLGSPYLQDPNHGRYIKNCVGVPPLDVLQKHFLNVTKNVSHVFGTGWIPSASARVRSMKNQGVTNAATSNDNYLNLTVFGTQFYKGLDLMLNDPGPGIPPGTFVQNIFGNQLSGQQRSKIRLKVNNLVSVTNDTLINQYTRTIQVSVLSGNWSQTGLLLHGRNVPLNTFVISFQSIPSGYLQLTLNNPVLLDQNVILTQFSYDVHMVLTTDALSNGAPIWKPGMLVSGRDIPQNTFIQKIHPIPISGKNLRLTLSQQVNLQNSTTISGYGDNLVVDDYRTSINEDSEQGMAITVECTDSCQTLHGYHVSLNSKIKNAFRLEGNGYYSEDSSVCMAAKHANVLPDCVGYVRLTFQRYDFLRTLEGQNWLDPEGAARTPGSGYTYTDPSLRNWKSAKIPTGTTYRVFSMENIAISGSVVHTVGGGPSAPLQGGCGFFDAQPSTLSYFNKPSGLAARPSATSLSQSEFMYIADSSNHRIRAISVSCTIICENGGTCTGPDICSCRDGWGGVDCTQPICKNTVCRSNSLCVGPDICGCKPGFSGTNCLTPQCVQKCQNHGICSAPDTCQCKPGWFDSNCTTPVCAATCANGGNCTAPNTCSCPDQWGGTDCRTPLCYRNASDGQQPQCRNGGYCVAPDTCACPPQYTNFDCTAPVCTQGFFTPYAEVMEEYKGAHPILKVEAYRPCDLQMWCNSTNEFECDQPKISYDTIAVPSGPANRKKTGRATKPNLCMNIEVYPSLVTPYELIYAATGADGQHETTGIRRYSPLTPYISDPRNPERGYYQATEGRTGPWTYSTDRQIANVAWYNITQGVYVCANGGDCVKPDVCRCADGWMGFDCRTPICHQGYYTSNQQKYVEGGNVTAALDRFFGFMEGVTNDTVFRGEYSNPTYTVQLEYYPKNDSAGTALYGSVLHREFRQEGGIRYSAKGGGHQGGYRCSIRAVTQWENETTVFSHPNYYSRYMDNKTELDGKTYTFWNEMQWPALHHKSRVLDTFPTELMRINTGAPAIYKPPLGTLKDANFPCDKGCVNPNCFDQCYFDLLKDTGIDETLSPPGARPPKMRNIYMSFANTNEGWRRLGEWNATGLQWQFGICIMQFFRNCSQSRVKEYDLHFQQRSKTVMETDVSYRPRIIYNDMRVIHRGRWNVKGGECIDQVLRGCYNNGTCVAPNQCACAPGWTGDDCTKPLCTLDCGYHHGNCTGPNQCTCERGWRGDDCRIPICAQDCMNGGICIAPDTCQCYQWANAFRDGRLNGGRPLYQDTTGTPLPTGWTGFDCATPICVQSETFHLNHRNPFKVANPGFFFPLGGQGGDNKLTCLDSSGYLQPRCPQFDVYVTGNEATTFQAGCGWDPFDSGCCVEDPSVNGGVFCFSCPPLSRVSTNNTYFCSATPDVFKGDSKSDTLKYFWKNPPSNLLRYCGRHHNPRYHDPQIDPEDMGRVRYYTDFLYRPEYSNRNYLNTLTSDRFLCNVEEWLQGDYNDDAHLGKISGVGSIYGLTYGRHIRINFANMKLFANGTFAAGGKIRGEGVFACKNSGSCIAPDICTCKDGYEGFDCSTPQCRHLQPSGAVSACLNGGVCIVKDLCNCVQVASMINQIYPEANAGITGWTGSDCTMPMCIQGFYDPFCTDLPEAPGGEGCYRCANGGNCTAPDVCKCADGWSGYDCKTPLCNLVADPLTRTQLATIFEDKVISFETDPCGFEAQYGVKGWKGTKYARGNCSAPNVCTCLCKDAYNPKKCKKTGKGCDGPWQDTLVNYRNVLTSRTNYPGSWIFGSTDCAYGYEGNVDTMDRFTSCHLTIYIPSDYERNTVQIIIGFVLSGFIVAILYYFIAARLRQKFLLAKVWKKRQFLKFRKTAPGNLHLYFSLPTLSSLADRAPTLQEVVRGESTSQLFLRQSQLERQPKKFKLEMFLSFSRSFLRFRTRKSVSHPNPPWW